MGTNILSGDYIPKSYNKKLNFVDLALTFFMGTDFYILYGH